MTARRAASLLRHGTIAAVLSTVWACGSPSSPSTLAPDTWGGPHVRLTIGATSSHFEFDCAHGDIPSPFTVDGRGIFSLNGTFVREHGGPVGENETPDSHPAAYTGSTTGGLMSLTIQLTDTSATIGTFALVRGATGQIVKCL